MEKESERLTVCEKERERWSAKKVHHINAFLDATGFSLSHFLSLLTVLCALLFYSFSLSLSLSLSLSFASIATYFLKRGKVIGRAQPQQQRTEQKRAEQTNKGTKVKQKNRLRRCYDNIKKSAKRSIK